MHVAVRRHQLRHLAEQSKVILQGRSELSFVASVALKYPKPTHDAPIHLREPHLPSELRLLARLAPADYGRVLLEDGNQFLFGRNLLPLKHPTGSLRNCSLKKPCEVGDLF